MTVLGHAVFFNYEPSRRRHCVGEDSDAVAQHGSSVLSSSDFSVRLISTAAASATSTLKMWVPLAAALCRQCLRIEFPLKNEEHWRAKTYAIGTLPHI